MSGLAKQSVESVNKEWSWIAMEIVKYRRFYPVFFSMKLEGASNADFLNITMKRSRCASL